MQNCSLVSWLFYFLLFTLKVITAFNLKVLFFNFQASCEKKICFDVQHPKPWSRPSLELFYRTVSADFFPVRKLTNGCFRCLNWKTRSSYYCIATTQVTAFLLHHRASQGPAIFDWLSQPTLEMFHWTCLFWLIFFLLEKWLIVAAIILIWKTFSSQILLIPKNQLFG